MKNRHDKCNNYLGLLILISRFYDHVDISLVHGAQSCIDIALEIMLLSLAYIYSYRCNYTLNISSPSHTHTYIHVHSHCSCC